jgi:hypothetical protein
MAVLQADRVCRCVILLDKQYAGGGSGLLVEVGWDFDRLAAAATLAEQEEQTPVLAIAMREAPEAIVELAAQRLKLPAAAGVERV